MCIPGVEGVKRERREGEVIDELCFVESVAEVGKIVHVRHVRFGDELHMRRGFVQRGAQELNHRVCLRQVDAVRAGFLPEISDRIEADEGRAALGIQKENVESFQQDLGILEIEIDLVFAEGRPNFFLAGGSLECCQQRQRPRTHHLRKVVLTFHGNEEIFVTRVILLEFLEPFALRRDVIDDPIEHQPKILHG